MSAILGYLFLGGKADAKDKVKLQKLGIKYILNCTPPRTLDKENGCSNFYEKEKSFSYKRIPIFDNKGEDILSHMNTAFDFIEEGKHYGKVLVHCHKGVSRSASFVIGYLMKKNEFTFEEALSHVQSCRSIVQPNTAFIEQLRTYKPHGNSLLDSSHSDLAPSLGPQPALSAVELNTDASMPSTIIEMSAEQTNDSAQQESSGFEPASEAQEGRHDEETNSSNSTVSMPDDGDQENKRARLS